MNNSYLLTCLIVFVLVYQMRENICGGNRLVEGAVKSCTSNYGCPTSEGWHHCGFWYGKGQCVSQDDYDEQQRQDSSICTQQ